MITLPNGWYDPVYEREQRRHPFVQLWEAQQRADQERYREERDARLKAHAGAIKAKAKASNDRSAYRIEKGYADKWGHTYPHIAEEAADLYLAGGTTYREVGEKYGLSPERIRQIVPRVQKKRGVY
jgi:DNA-binding CsgD family transcriptional regulator